MFFFLNIDLACVLPIFAGLLGAFILGWLLRHLFFDNNRLALLQEENKNLKYEHDFEMSKKNANYSSLENKHFDLKYNFSKVNEEVGEANKKIESLSSALEAEKLKPPVEKIVEVPKETIVENFERINQLQSELDLHKQLLDEERSKPAKEVVVEKPYEDLERVNHLQSELELHKYLLEEERSKPAKEVVVEKPYEDIGRVNQLQNELNHYKQLLDIELNKSQTAHHPVESYADQIEQIPQDIIIEDENSPYVVADYMQNDPQHEEVEANSIPKDLVEPYSVFFSPDEKGYALGDILKSYLDRTSPYFLHHPEKKLLVIGYTDNIGGIEENIQLSEQRASFIKNELSLLGIDADRIETLGRGMMDPLGDNSSEEGRSKNRRVSIQII